MSFLRRSPLAILSATFLLAACSSSSPSSDEGTNVAAVCHHAYTALVKNAAHCTSAVSGNMTDEARFEQACVVAFSADGTSTALATEDQCVSAIEALTTCVDTDLPAVCQGSLKGTLATGTACGEDIQCATGYCKGAGLTQGVDGTASVGCGVCAEPIAVGKACDPNGATACADNAYCQTDASGSAGVCTKPTYAHVGESCAGLAVCSDSRCDLSTEKCVALSDAGATCYSGADCKSPLACINFVCAAGNTEGATCTTYGDCAQPLYCAGLTGANGSTGTCKKITYGAAGAVCDGDAALCRVGVCPFTTGGEITTCPTIIPDGQACGAAGTTCDDEASCVNGKCAIVDPSICK